VLTPHEQVIRSANTSARIILIQGNEERVCRWLDANPSATGLVEPEVVLRLKDRRIEWIPYWSTGEVLRIGKAMSSMVATRMMDMPRSMRCVTVAMFSMDTPIQSDAYSHELYGTDTTYIAQSLGCLCKPMRWMQGKPDKWQQAFAVFEFMGDGEFGYSVVRIKNHGFVFDGKIYGR
jgi:hypothetical protein